MGTRVPLGGDACLYKPIQGEDLCWTIALDRPEPQNWRRGLVAVLGA
jgi:hypothetical protein